ncbi:MAG: class I tRNA ligase family protein, partial [Phycisphaeraceae bacterium]|nr:class I tRNA ligase family protein [Phycisphaeraceae bacterium]
DVLDTWFSSALWPLSTMGWPGDTELLRAFNPSSTLCTAREIITLWVSRMVMFNRYLMPEGWGGRGGTTRSVAVPDPTRSVGVPGELPSGRGNGPVPFRDVVIHAVIQDGEGRKMSKSLGNGIDPLDIIATHGSDAMRFILAQMATQTQDVRLPVEKDPTGRNTSSKFDLGKRLCNKLWNASRLALSKLPRGGQDTNPPHPVHARDLSLVDRWMLARVVATTQAVDAALANYEFAQYATAVYDLLWRDFCDWYLEAIKPTIDNNPQQQAVLAHTLEVILRLAHPAMPYVTEAIWEQARQVRVAPIVGLHLPPAQRDDLLCLAGWPEIDLHLRDAQAEGAFERLREVVEAVREVRAAQQVHPKRKITLHTSPALVAEFHTAGALVPTLAGLGSVIGITDLVSFVAPHGALKIRLHGEDAWLSDLADAVDAKAADAMTAKRIAELEKQHDTITTRLNNPGYAQRAPAKLVEESKAQLQAIKAELAVLRG